MDDRLFSPAHRDASTLSAAPAAAAVSGTPAGLPVKSVIDGEAAGTPASESSIPTVLPDGSLPPAQFFVPASTSLDPLESSVNFLDKLPLPSEIVLNETSLCSSFRHSGWAPIRKKVFESLRRTGQTDSRLREFASCGVGAWVKRSNETERGPDGVHRHHYTVSGSNCHDRLCTPCANARSATIRNKLMAMVGDRKVIFITLTLSGKGQRLLDLVDRLYKHFRALRLHPTWADRVTGGAAFIEIKWNAKAKRWHPHLHVICESSFLPQQELCNAWRSITKDSFIVDIRPVSQRNVVASYVCKYASKPLDGSFTNDADLLDEAVVALKGRRLCTTFGDWYGTPLTYAEDEEIGDEGIIPFTYSTFESLESVLQRALAGDVDYVNILISMGAYDRVDQLPRPHPS